MIKRSQIFLVSVLLLLNSCITQFIPKTSEDKEILVVEGLITDQPALSSVKLSKSFPLGGKSSAMTLSGYIITVSDDLGSIVNFTETSPGTYSPPGSFIGVAGRIYTLHIKSNSASNGINYESFPVEMKVVPPIDSIYYEKKTIVEGDNNNNKQEGCQIYLNTHDPTNQCKFFRWEYTETWKFLIPYSVKNQVCWISSNSDIINVKSTVVLSEDKIIKYPLNFISNLTDRLRVKYSILVKQYSLNEDEYLYWEKLQSIGEHVGGLYDIIPSSVPGNVFSLTDPNERVLGYFSVSATTSKRIFIKDYFAGTVTPYTDARCIADTIPGNGPVPDLNNTVWILVQSSLPPYIVTTNDKGCSDCTLRGTNVKPDFWTDDK
jgi:hypothetical protein